MIDPRGEFTLMLCVQLTCLLSIISRHQKYIFVLHCFDKIILMILVFFFLLWKVQLKKLAYTESRESRILEKLTF